MKRFFTTFIFYIFFSIILLSCGKKCKDVDIPYEVTEEVETKLSYLTGKSTWKRIDGMTLFNVLPKLHTETELTNTSQQGGVFKLVKTCETTQDKKITFEDSKYINAGATINFVFEEELPPYITIKDDNTTIDVFAPTIKVSKRVTKYRKCNTCEEDCLDYLTNGTVDSVAVKR